MPLLSETASKATPDSKVGVTVSTLDGKVYLKAIRDDGIFAWASKLKPGQEIVSVNGITIKGMAVGDIVQIMKLSPRDVMITVRVPLSYTLRCTLESDHVTLRPPSSNEKSICPQMLSERGVSLSKWKRIFNKLTMSLVPAVEKYLHMERAFQQEMVDYISKKTWKGDYQHERKVYMMVNQSSILHNNATMKACDVLTEVNALVNSHGLIANILLKTRPLPKYSSKQTTADINMAKIPIGLNFKLIDDDEEEEDENNDNGANVGSSQGDLGDEYC